MNIYEKLNEIQQKLKANKSQYNKFGGYKYRNCEDILEAVKPLLAETETVILLSDDIQNIGERYYVKATAILKDCESDEKIENVAFAREEENKKGMDGSQVTGASSSYARKYALNGLFAIDDTKDSETTNHCGKDDISNIDEKLVKECGKYGIDIQKVAQYYKIEVKDLTNDLVKQAIEMKVKSSIKES